MKEGPKLYVIVDEDSTISCKLVLIIYVKVEDCELSPTIFLGFVELEGQGAKAIHRCLLESLNSVGYNMAYLRNNFVDIFSDGASVMLGRSSAVVVSEQLEQEILKTAIVLGPRWAACSLRAAQAV